MNRLLFLLMLLVLMPGNVFAQHDKAQADSLILNLLSSDIATTPPKTRTADKGRHHKGEVFMISGKYYQINTLRNDVYYRTDDKIALAIDNARYPMETMNNLLLGVVPGKNREITVVHHQYGGKSSTLMMPFDELMSKLSPGKELYCSVTSINDSKVEGFTVFYDRKKNAIHMLQVVAPLQTIMSGKGEMTADLYTNIPQNGIKDLFGVEPDNKANASPNKNNKKHHKKSSN